MANIRKKFKGKVLFEIISLSLVDTPARWKPGWISKEEVSLLLSSILWRKLNFGRYVAKIIFTYILGYKVDVGHMEAVNLISSSKYSEKQIVRPINLYHARPFLKPCCYPGLLGSHTPYARKL